MDAERREEELLARFRLRMARAASRIALIVIAALAAVVLQVEHLVTAAQVPLVLLLAAAAVISLAAHRRSRPMAAPLPLPLLAAWVAAVLAFDSMVVWLHGDPASDIYLSYLLPVLFAAAVLPAWGAALALMAAVTAYVAIVLSLDAEMRRMDLLLRAATFAVIGLLGAYLAREQQREIAARVQKERDLGRVLERAISAQEGERGRIARELHDGPVQAVAMLSMRLGLVEEAVRSGGAKARLVEARVALRETNAELRRIIHDLRPSALDDLGLVDAIHDLTSARCDEAGVRLEWDVSGPRRRLAAPIETAVFRIAQEAVTNVVRHAHARSARVAIRFEDGRVSVSVEDDGVGFDAARVQRAGGVGLLGMRERAVLVGGTLELASAPRAGTRVTARIPLEVAA